MLRLFALVCSRSTQHVYITNPRYPPSSSSTVTCHVYLVQPKRQGKRARMEGRDKGEGGGWSARETRRSGGLGAENTWQNQTGRSGG
eukprot:1756251-Pyramimonas_sp.AAC.1